MRTLSTVSATMLGMGAVFAVSAALGCDSRVHLGDLVWTATFEAGDLSEWVGDGKGGTRRENATVESAATTEVAHRGQFAGRVTATPAMGMLSISYLFRERPSPVEGYYSAWFNIPASFTVRRYLSLLHFQSSRTADGRTPYGTWDVNIYPRLGGLVAHLYNFETQLNEEQVAPIPVPIGQWVHFEMFMRKATDATGRVTVWQDGVLILDIDRVVTGETPWMQWSVGAALEDIELPVAVVYVDDAAISLSRVGVGGMGGAGGTAGL